MSTVWSSLAALVGVAHLALIVLLVAGAPLALRWPAIARVHLVALAATSAVFVAGADCPLTVWQRAAIERSGATPYEGGFVEHHLVEPITGTGMTPGIEIAVVAAWVVPTLAGYAVTAARRGRVSAGA